MFEYSFMQNACIVALLISLVCPMIGMFLVLRRYSMIGDALSHASLAGVAVGLLIDVNPIISAFCLTSFFGVLIEALRNQFRRYAELVLILVGRHCHYDYQCRPGSYQCRIIPLWQHSDGFLDGCLVRRYPQHYFSDDHPLALPPAGHDYL